MKQKNIKNSFNQVKPDEKAKGRMLTNIIKNRTERNKLFIFKKNIPILLLVFILAIGGVTSYLLVLNKNNLNKTASENNVVSMEDSIAEIRDEFYLDDRQYYILDEEKAKEFGFSTEISNRDIGDKLATITTSIDERLLGKDVYHYLPAESEAIVAVEAVDGYTLFRFYNFESYLENQDEAAKEYLELYGINEAADIEKIQFNSHGVMTDTKSIEQFYTYYSGLENASDQYFDSLFNWGDDKTNDNTEIPSNDTEGESTPAFEGTSADALANAVKIRIYHHSGVFYQTIYYPNIGFISRHQVADEFATFLGNYIN